MPIASESNRPPRPKAFSQSYLGAGDHFTRNANSYPEFYRGRVFDLGDGGKSDLISLRNDFRKRLDAKLPNGDNKFTRSERYYLLNAFDFAARHHAGQERKSGDPAFIHPYQVAIDAMEQGGSVAHIAVAFLHDVVEDVEDPDPGRGAGAGARIKRRQADLLREVFEWFGGDVKANVGILTRDYQKSRSPLVKQRQYRAYAFKIFNKPDPRMMVAKWVKCLDSWHNLRTIGNISDAKARQRQLKKYEHIYDVVARFDAHFGKLFREELVKHGVYIPLAPPRERVVVAPSRLWQDARLLKALPRPDALCAVLYEPHAKNPKQVTVGLPLSPGRNLPDEQLGREAERQALLAKLGTWLDSAYFTGRFGGAVVRLEPAQKTLPSNMGGRAHFNLTFDRVVSRRDIASLKKLLTSFHSANFRRPWLDAQSTILAEEASIRKQARKRKGELFVDAVYQRFGGVAPHAQEEPSEGEPRPRV